MPNQIKTPAAFKRPLVGLRYSLAVRRRLLPVTWGLMRAVQTAAKPPGGSGNRHIASPRACLTVKYAFGKKDET